LTFPYLVPRALTIWQTAAVPASQIFMLLGTLVLLPIVLGYITFVYWLSAARCARVKAIIEHALRKHVKPATTISEQCWAFEQSCGERSCQRSRGLNGRRPHGCDRRLTAFLRSRRSAPAPAAGSPPSRCG
jgi:hypothetical protein